MVNTSNSTWFHAMRLIWGIIVSLHRMVIILNDYKIIKEAFVGKGNDCSGRPDVALIQTTYNPHYPLTKGKQNISVYSESIITLSLYK